MEIQREKARGVVLNAAFLKRLHSIRPRYCYPKCAQAALDASNIATFLHSTALEDTVPHSVKIGARCAPPSTYLFFQSSSSRATVTQMSGTGLDASLDTDFLH